MPKYPLQLPPLSDENDFEKLVNKLCQKKYNLDSFQLYGRKGSKQYGIDGITLSEDKKLIVFQAKKKEDIYKTDKTIRSKLIEELESEVRQFDQEFVQVKDYQVQEFIFASTFKRDTELQNKALELSKTYGFKVTFWGWDDISEMIHDYEDVLSDFYGFFMNANPTKIKDNFQNNSSILLSSRNLYISRNYIPIPELEKIHEFINNDNDRNNILVVVGKAGIGKTALLSEVQYHLKEEDHAYLSIKSDQVILSSKSSLSQQFEVDNLYESIIILTQEERLTIIVDQLDALSLTLSSDRNALLYMLEFIESLKERKNINIVVSVREYDLNNDPLLKQIDDSNKIRINHLSEMQVFEVLDKQEIDKQKISTKLKELLTTPLYLALFLEVYSSSESYTNIQSIQDLYELFWKERIISNIGELEEKNIRNLIYQLANKMNEKQQIEVAKLPFEETYGKELDLLISRNIIIVNEKRIKFFHQTFYDYVFARNFIQSSESLFEYITSRHQGLSIREQVKQIIEFLRGTDPDEYLKQIELFLFDEKIHFHFKLLVISYLGSIENPTEAEFELIERLFDKDKKNLLYFIESWISLGWMSYFVNAKYFSKIYLEDEMVGDRLKYKPEIFVNQDSHRMLEIIDGFPESNDKNKIMFMALNRVEKWDEYIIDVFRKYDKNSETKEKIHFYVDFWKKIASHNQELMIDIMFEYLHNDLNTYDDIDIDKKDFLDSQIINFLKELIKNKSLDVLKQSLSFLEKIVLKTSKERDSKDYFLYNGSFYGMYQFDYDLYNIWNFYKIILDELKIVAHENRELFLSLTETYKNSKHLPLFGLFILGCADEANLYKDKLYDLFINLKLIETISFNTDIGYALLKLINKTFELYEDEQQINLINIIRNVNPKWELKWFGSSTTKYQGNLRGYQKYQLLLQIPKEKLKKFNIWREFQELERKFFWHKETKPHKSSGGLIGAPLGEDIYMHMSLDQWKQSMKVYSHNSVYKRVKDFMQGGQREHSSTFQKIVRENPDRFYNFLFELYADKDIEVDYICSGFNALVESKYDKEKISKAIIAFADCNDKYFQLSIIRTINDLAHENYFNDKFIDILERYKDIEYEGITEDKDQQSISDCITKAINSVQGVLANTVPNIFKFTTAKNRDRIIDLIYHFVNHKNEYVVFGLLRSLGTIDRLDKDLYEKFVFDIINHDEKGRLTLYLMDSLHYFLNRKVLSYEMFSEHVQKSLDFISSDNQKDEENLEQRLGQILFFHYLTNNSNSMERLLTHAIDISSNIVKGVINQAFYEINSGDGQRVELAKKYILLYKNHPSAEWNFHFSMEKLHDGNFIENDIAFLKELATSVVIHEESQDFWDYLKNEFYTKKSRAQNILEIIEVFINSYRAKDKYGDYRAQDKIEFIIELYNRFKTDEYKEKVLIILEKFLQNDNYRNIMQRQLDE